VSVIKTVQESVFIIGYIQPCPFSLCALYQGFSCLVPVPLDQVPFQRLDPLLHPVGIGAFQRAASTILG